MECLGLHTHTSLRFWRLILFMIARVVAFVCVNVVSTTFSSYNKLVGGFSSRVFSVDVSVLCCCTSVRVLFAQQHFISTPAYQIWPLFCSKYLMAVIVFLIRLLCIFALAICSAAQAGGIFRSGGTVPVRSFGVWTINRCAEIPRWLLPRLLGISEATVCEWLSKLWEDTASGTNCWALCF